MQKEVSALRLGSYYRAVLAPYLGIAPTGPRVLDVGAADGQFLRRFPTMLSVALDIAPQSDGAVSFVRGDGRSAPFRSGAFDTVFAFDVLEHVAEDAILIQELVRLMKPGGTLWISVPSTDFAAFPPFATGFLHRKWGHVRPGYRPSDLVGLIPCQADIAVMEWNEPVCRLAYFLVKGVSLVAPGMARWLLRLTARLDRTRRAGHRGHYFCRVRIADS